MRRLTGFMDAEEHVVLEYPDGRVECRSDLRSLLEQGNGTMPTGVELEQTLRLLFGETLVVREV